MNIGSALRIAVSNRMTLLHLDLKENSGDLKAELPVPNAHEYAGI